MKTDRRSAWILIVALAAGCGAAPLPGEEATDQSTVAQPLDGVRINPFPPIDPQPLPTSGVIVERLVWTRDSSFEVWAIDQWGSVRSVRSLVRPGLTWWAMGTAGDRLLVAREDSADAQLWTLDSSNNFVSSITLTSQEPSFRATGLSLEMTPATSCYHRGDTQNYWVTWDQPVSSSHPTRDMLVQTIGGDGHNIQTEQLTKPAWQNALAFGLGPDDHMHVLFSDTGTFATGTIYDADWVIGSATTTGHYQLHAPAMGTGARHVSNFQPTSRSLWRVPPMTFIWGGGSTKGERMLFTSLGPTNGNDRAQLAVFDELANYLRTKSYELNGRGFATAYTWLPPACP